MTETSRVIREKPACDQTEKKNVIQEEHKWSYYWPNIVALALLHVMAVYGCTLRPEITVIGETAAKLLGLFSSIGITAGVHRLWCHRAYKAKLPAQLAIHVTWRKCLPHWPSRRRRPTPKLLGLFSSIGITAGVHRLWCHRAYKAKLPAQLLLMFLASLTYQNSVYTWCRDHRLHHKYSETDADPHNAKRGFFFSHVGWLMVRKHPVLQSKKYTVDMSDLEANPVVMFQHKYYYIIVLMCSFLLSTFLPWYLWNESLKVSFFRITIFRYVITVNFTWFINSFAHLYGNKPYDKKIGPVESPVICYSSLGESFHNYHHTFPWDYKAAELSNDTRNATTIFIDILAWLGWVYDRKTLSKEIIERRMKRTGDGKFNPNRTIFYQYLPEKLDRFLKNVYNGTIVFLFFYIL